MYTILHQNTDFYFQAIDKKDFTLATEYLPQTTLDEQTYYFNFVLLQIIYLYTTRKNIDKSTLSVHFLSETNKSHIDKIIKALDDMDILSFINHLFGVYTKEVEEITMRNLSFLKSKLDKRCKE